METSYMVLRQIGTSPGQDLAPKKGWDELGTFDASSAQAAVRTAADANGEGQYVAVPSRSFKPVVVKVATKKVVSFA
jgi:hypothetical protein